MTKQYASSWIRLAGAGHVTTTKYISAITTNTINTAYYSANFRTTFYVATIGTVCYLWLIRKTSNNTTNFIGTFDSTIVCTSFNSTTYINISANASDVIRRCFNICFIYTVWNNRIIGITDNTSGIISPIYSTAFYRNAAYSRLYWNIASQNTRIRTGRCYIDITKYNIFNIGYCFCVSIFTDISKQTCIIRCGIDV